MRAAGQAAGMRYARWFAAAIILGVGVAAFRLSYSTLEDLAVLAHIPARDAWLFPLIVDGTILLATAGVLVCPGRERRFFLSVLVVGSAVSVAGNSLHAVANGQPLPAWASALVAAIAPVSLLADTHGLALLFRAAQRNSSDEGSSFAAPAPAEPPAEPEAEAEAAPVMAVVPEPEPEPEPEREPMPASVEVPRPVAAPVKRPVRSSRPVQDMLPIALPIGS
ncbi:DUF2637 domain-containing protein [Nocardia farcinica]|uniref:Protein of uncharacterized function (DUF2637) n=1 Tax=Nocardia farcinica TaxID=37329 RepID=A0A0H5NNY3_NOCFR|nr:DUF2637 domain-containing protein [Nocardia farcinica]PFW99247.1 hypothetical protein CJ469_05510 [Nocardia farcinica]PFX00886.1 hypothetical protein CJ468_06175 [Nocardia farcinica]CRY77585.1 Protein of uncharacterised function (DUF2637) [Nocardia farcinica]SIT33133.1 Protein of unknown function [Nocardia farcinica]